MTRWMVRIPLTGVKRFSRSLALFSPLLSIVLFGSGCASLHFPAAPLEEIRSGEMDPCWISIVCEGMLRDLGSPWDKKLQKEIVEEDGGTSIRVSYWSEPFGVWMNCERESPVTLLVEMLDEIASVHGRSECRRPLLIDAIGFSNGCEILLEVADRFEIAHFRKLVLIQSSSFFYSKDVERLTQSGRIQKLRNYHSYCDVVNLFAPLGAGFFGLRGGGDRVENVRRFQPHFGSLITRSYRQHIRSYLDPGSREERPDPAYVDALTGLFLFYGWPDLEGS